MKSKRTSLRRMLAILLTFCMLAGHAAAAPSMAYAAEEVPSEVTTPAEPDVPDVPEVHEHIFENYIYNEDATCEEDGTETGVCSVAGCSVTDTRTVPGTALGHEYSEKDYQWIWSSDHSTATLIMVCSYDTAHTRIIEATIDSKITIPATCTQSGRIQYTATAIIEEVPPVEETDPTIPEPGPMQPVTATNTILVSTPPTGHDYQLDSWTWSEDHKSAVANLVCSKNPSHVSTANATVSYKMTSTPTCTVAGEGIYTGKIRLNGEEYIDTQTVSLDPIGHDYQVDSWKWAEDYNAATANVICSHDSSHSYQLPAVITAREEKVTCTTDGSIVYTASASLADKTVTSERRKTIQTRLDHDYKLVDWIWAPDNTSATAYIECQNDKEHNYTIDAEITSDTTATCSHDGITTYTAAVTYNGHTYTNQKSIEADAIGHDYGTPEFRWKGLESCKLAATCSRCEDVHTVACHITTTEIKEDPAAKTHSKTMYTAEGTIFGEKMSDSVTIEDTTHRPAATLREAAEDQGYDDVIRCEVCQEELARTHVTFRLYFDGNEGGGEMAPMTVEYGVPTTLPACEFENPGYHFYGWFAMRLDETIYAQINETPGWYTVEELMAAEVTDPVLPADMDISTITDSCDDEIILFPGWESNVVTITFSKHGGKGTMETMDVYYGCKTTLTPNAFTRTGYTFSGWYAYRKSDGTFYAKNSAGKKGWYTTAKIKENGYSKVLIRDEASVAKLSTVDGDQLTYYAQWKPNTYSIQFNRNGGTSGSMSRIKKIAYNETRTLTANGFKKNGYRFAGWAACRESDGKWYAMNPATQKRGWYKQSYIAKKNYHYIIFRDMTPVKGLTSLQGEIITMYAQWVR